MEKDIIIGGNWTILDEKYEGSLVFNKTNGLILLDIYYNDENSFFAWQGKPNEFDEIIGTTYQKSKCILTDCRIVKTLSKNNIHNVIIKAKSLFFGINNRKKDTLKFNEMRFQLSNIIIWSKLSGFENIESNPSYWINIAYNPKDAVSIVLNETTIEFIPGMGSFNPDMSVEKIDISQYVSICIKKGTQTHYEKFFDDLEKVINLISFSTNQKINIRKIECIDYNHFNENNRIKEYIRYEMISDNMKYEELSSKNDIHSVINYLFDLPEIMKENKIMNWFNNYDKRRNIYNLYLLSIKNNIPKEIKFCNIMQSIELIHNLQFSKKRKFYTHINKKFDLSPKLIDNIKSDEDQSASNYIILRSRMIDLLSNDYYKIEDDDIIKLSDILTDSRNYYTHYNDSKKKKCVIKKNLDYAFFFINVITSCYILTNLGFSLDYIKEKNKRNFEIIDKKEMIKNIIENKR